MNSARASGGERGTGRGAERRDPGGPTNAAALVLFVEDDVMNLEVVREMVLAAGHRCDHAAGGKDAVEAVKQQDYDIVLMDCCMPGMDGYETTRRIREWEKANDSGRRLPIIAVTGQVMKTTRERCLDCGMDDYMTKPLLFNHLAIMIAKWKVMGAATDSKPGSE